MKHDITAPGGIQFKEDSRVQDGNYGIYIEGQGFYQGPIGDGRWLAKNYTPGEVICLSPRDYAGVMNGKISTAYDPAATFSQGGTVNRAPEMNLILHAASIEAERPWHTVMSAPEGVELECRNNEGPKRILRKHNGCWHACFGRMHTYPPTHWRYPKNE